MSLSSITSVPQSGSFELLSTQLTNPPALTNNSGSTVTVAITATGEWSLLNANFVTSDPNIIRYKKLVDGDGLTREKSDEKFKFKYPNLNPAILVGEIKDAKGNTKSTVSGKQQSFELEPGESVSFIINDDPKWYGDNAGKLTISYTATTKTVEPTKPIEPQTKPELYTITDLYNTGVDNARQVLGDSVADSHYTLATYPAGTVTPGVTTPNKDLAPINWIANTQTARWIGPNTASSTGPVGDYSYKTTFTLPSFSEASIIGQIAVDDRITDILINGVSVGNPVPLSSWTTIQRFSISTGFVVGTNTIEFKLHSIGGPTGIQIDAINGTYRPSSNKVSVLSFDGKDDYVALPAVNNDYSQGFTVEAWVQYSSFQQSWSRIIEFGNGPGQNNIVLGHVVTSNNIGFHLYTTAGLHTLEIANSLEIGKWTHIAVTISKSQEGKLYQNGQLVQTKPFALPDIVNRKLNYIAKSSWAQDGYFEGKIAEVRVWNIARTPEEIKQNINSRLSGNEPGLVGYYPLNGDANDKTSKANHGTINGAIWQQGEVHITG